MNHKAKQPELTGLNRNSEVVLMIKPDRCHFDGIACKAQFVTHQHNTAKP